jgi:hypothetical protein
MSVKDYKCEGGMMSLEKLIELRTGRGDKREREEDLLLIALGGVDGVDSKEGRLFLKGLAK